MLFSNQGPTSPLSAGFTVLGIAAIIALAFLPLFAAYYDLAGKAPVKAVRNGIEYLPAEQEGCLEAYWLHTDLPIWNRQIYVVRHACTKSGGHCGETDSISKLNFENDSALRIETSRGGIYRLDVNTLRVEQAQGSMICSFRE